MVTEILEIKELVTFQNLVLIDKNTVNKKLPPVEDGNPV